MDNNERDRRLTVQGKAGKGAREEERTDDHNWGRRKECKRRKGKDG